MEEQLIEFQTAKLAKEKGFPQPLQKGSTTSYDMSIKYGYYNLTKKLTEDYFLASSLGHIIYVAPTQSLLQKWLREEYNIHIFITSIGISKFYYYIEKLDEDGSQGIESSNFNEQFKTYEQALEKGLFEALKLI